VPLELLELTEQMALTVRRVRLDPQVRLELRGQPDQPALMERMVLMELLVRLGRQVRPVQLELLARRVLVVRTALFGVLEQARHPEVSASSQIGI
jgi:hypothetical protein